MSTSIKEALAAIDHIESYEVNTEKAGFVATAGIIRAALEAAAQEAEAPSAQSAMGSPTGEDYCRCIVRRHCENCSRLIAPLNAESAK